MTRKTWQVTAILGGLLALHCGPSTPRGGVGGAGGSVGGTGGTGGNPGGTGGGGSGGIGGGQNPTQLPSPVGTCPTLRTGTNAISLNGRSMSWTLNVGQRVAGAGGPVIIYWHATGSSASEVNSGFGAAAIQEVVSQGGVVASAVSTTGTGANTGNSVWHRGDFAYADQIVACAIQQLNIDTRRIHTLGYSAGGLQSVAYGYDRNGYVASLASYSGGLLFPNAPQDPNYLPPAMMMHGPRGSDVVIIDFYNASHGLYADYEKKGQFAIDCADNEGHVSGTRLAQAPLVWQFFKAHPYKVQPFPWLNGLPSNFPSRCTVASP